MLSGKVNSLEEDNMVLKEDNKMLSRKVNSLDEANKILEEADNSLFFINAERDICQVLDVVYASILKELQTSGNFTNNPTLSSLLASKMNMNNEEKKEEDEKIVRALSSQAKLDSQEQALLYWKALSAVKQRRNLIQHYELDGGAEEAKRVLADYLKY